MTSIRGTIRNGKVEPAEPIDGREGQEVIITFPDGEELSSESEDAEWAALWTLLDEARVDTGIPDLAHQHDHYLHGTPKREA